MIFGICPNCDNKVDVGGQPEINSHLICETCQIDLVVVWLNPIELLIKDYGDYELFDDDLYQENIIKFSSKKKENMMPAGKTKKGKKGSTSSTGKKKTVKK
ncbi:MAG: hypothetical protein MUO54_02785 [Anaerolineales bacterium]|nr:hypothetical protein [Anaerolineales bacterium]